MSNRQRYRLGMSAFNAGRLAEAIVHLTPLARHPSGATALLSRFYLGQAHYQLAVELFKKRQFGEAGGHFQAAAQFNPGGGGFAGFLAACYVGTGQYDLAARELNTLCQREPDDADVRIRLALTQWKQGRPLEAIASLRAALVRDPEHPELNYQLAVMLADDDNLTEAERLFEKTLVVNPAHVGALERLAQVYGVNGRYERAFEYLQQAQQLDPTNARIALQLNLLAQALGEPGRPRTVEWAASARDKKPMNETALERLGRVVVSEPEFIQAFLSLPPSAVDEEVFSTLAATLETALARYPEYADLHFHCGAIYRRLGRSDDAIRHTRQAVEINPRYVGALIQLAQLYAQTDQYAAGVVRLDEAIKAGADYPDVYYLMGQLMQKVGQKDEARQAYRRALALKQDYRAARDALVSLSGSPA